MTRRFLFAIFLSAIAGISAQEEDGPDIDFRYGPIQADMGEMAEIEVPEGYLFADGDNTRLLMEQMGNPPTDTEMGFISPETMDWFIVFEFSDTGYIDDEDQESLDPDQLIASMREGNRIGNEWRRERGMAELELIGWEKQPAYDRRTNNLEWATLSRAAGEDVVNYNIRLLGRKGVMEVTLVLSPEQLDEALPVVRGILSNYSYKEGNRYADYEDGDPVAEYGLAALIAGGAAAVAAKSGFLARFWKLLVAGAVGLAAMLKRFFGGRKNTTDLTGQG